MSANPTPWHVLIVDDEEDVHGVTNIVLKRKTWRGRPIRLQSARSGKEAREILQRPDTPRFHCALVDVVMETNDAGLQLCDFIRSTMPRTMRIILRTGQPGAAPPDKVLNDYDIDYYLAKTEVTEERLYAVLRACFRSSLDISALLAVGSQLRAFTAALNSSTTTRESLVAVMLESLKYLEDKYSCQVAFVADASQPSAGLPVADAATVASAIQKAFKAKKPISELLLGTEFGLPPNVFVAMTTSVSGMARTEKGVGDRLKKWFQSIMSEDETEDAVSGVAVAFERELPPRTQQEFSQDLELFLANWRVADGSFRLQDKLVRDRMEMLKKFGAGAGV